MTQEFDLLKSLNIEVSAAPTPSRGSFATPSVDWDARSHSSLASSVVSLSIDKLSGAVVDRMVAHAREASPRHSLEFFKGPSHSLGKQHNPSSIADGASSDAWSVSGPASAAPSIVSHWSNKCRVPPPTLKHSHASSRAQSVVDREEPRARGSDTIVLQLSSGLRASEQLPSSAAATATNSAPSSVPASVVAQAAYTSHAPVSEPAASDSGSAAPRHSVSSHTPAQSFTSARPYTAHGVSPLSILVGCGERQPNVSARRVQQQKYAQDLAQQIQTRSSISAPAARKSEPVPASTSLHFHPSESSQPLAYPRERCPFQISKQEYKQQLLKQISDRVQAKQQQQQHDYNVYQKSMYGNLSLQAQPPLAAQAVAHPIPLGVRSFLDSGNRSNDKATRQEYAAQLKKQIQTQKALKSRPSNA